MFFHFWHIEDKQTGPGAEDNLSNTFPSQTEKTRRDEKETPGF
jgi:hypothetical protein